MDRITESELYAELVAAHKRGLPVQPGDITPAQFAKDIHATIDVARIALDNEVLAGRLVKVKRTSENNRPMFVYRAAEQKNTSGD